MKIAMIDPSLFTLPYDRALAEALRDGGHEVTLYARGLGPKEAGKGLPYLSEFFYPGFQNLKNLPKPVFLALKGIVHCFCMAALWVRLALTKPDIIHFQWTPLPIVDRFFLPFFQRLAPLVLTVHDSSPFNNNPRAKLQAMGAIDIMKDFDRLIVHTNKAQAVLEGRGIPPYKIIRIDHGVIGADMSLAEKIARPSDGDGLNILLFGHLKPYKGADILIRALAAIPEESRKKIRLHIAGKPQMDVAPLYDLARKLGVYERIEWTLRFIDEAEIPSLFACSDVTAMPYREIDASGVLMVALSIGKPIVATRIGLFEEILQDGVHGYLIPMEDHNALGQALQRLADQPQTRTLMADNVRALGKSIPTWSEIAEKTEALYKEAIDAF